MTNVGGTKAKEGPEYQLSSAIAKSLRGAGEILKEAHALLPKDGGVPISDAQGNYIVIQTEILISLGILQTMLTCNEFKGTLFISTVRKAVEAFQEKCVALTVAKGPTMDNFQKLVQQFCQEILRELENGGLLDLPQEPDTPSQ